MQFTPDGPRKRDESFGLPGWQVAGFSVLFVALLLAFFLVPDPFVILGLVVGAAGAGKAVINSLKAGENDELPPASSAFLQLADPKRPLPPSTSPAPDPVAGRTTVPGPGGEGA